MSIKKSLSYKCNFVRAMYLEKHFTIYGFCIRYPIELTSENAGNFKSYFVNESRLS